MVLHILSENKYDQRFKTFIEKEAAYHYIDKIGAGAYGVVYLIEDRASQKKYVLKRLKLKHSQKKSIRQKFNQEIKILKELSSLNVPSVINQGEINEIPFYIMEHIEGLTFEQAIFDKGQLFSVKQSLQIVKHLLNIVILLHEKGIVHRDLRIPNIIIQDSQLTIIDFGLATYIKNDVDLNKIKNPKRVENHISDLYFIGHFLLFLLYSSYSPTKKKEKSWQEELQLPQDVVKYIERLLFIQLPFSSAKEALLSIPEHKNKEFL